MVNEQLVIQYNEQKVHDLCTQLTRRLPQLEKYSYVYGVPRGGVIPAKIVAMIIGAKVTENPECADLIVDDIIDSGRTRDQHCKKYGARFEALVDKTSKEFQYPPRTWITFPWEINEDGEDVSMYDIPIRFLEAIGEDPSRDGLKDTPKRIVKSWKDLYKGYNQDPAEALGTVFENDGNYDEMVVLKDIEFYSTCEHHAQPFFGSVTIAYLPKKKIVGISKLARLVEVYARRLQVQERLNQQIADSIMEILTPLGCGVVIKAKHFCMISRGVQKQNSVMFTSALKGKFLEDSTVRD